MPDAPKSKRGGARPGAGAPKGKKHGPRAKTRAIRAAVQRSHDLTAQAVLEQIRRGSQFDVRQLFDAAGNLRPMRELTAEEAMPIAGFEVVKRNLTAGDGKTDVIIKVKLVDRSRYVEMGAKHHGLLVEKVDITGAVTFTERIARARQRLAAAKA